MSSRVVARNGRSRVGNPSDITLKPRPLALAIAASLSLAIGTARAQSEATQVIRDGAMSGQGQVAASQVSLQLAKDPSQPGPNFQVNSAADDFSYCYYYKCTLRGAIFAANANPDASSIAIGPSFDNPATASGAEAGTGHPTLDLSALGPTPPDILLNTALPPITSVVTIEGNGGTVSAQQQSGIFHVAEAGTLTINNFTLEDGAATKGSCIYSLSDVTLNNSKVTQCWYAPDNTGGTAIYLKGAYLQVNNSELQGSYVYGNGGAMSLNAQSTVAINNSKIWEHYSYDANGGTFFLTGNSSLTVDNSELRNGQAQTGGLFMISDGSSVTVTDSTLSRNDADAGYGGMAYIDGSASSLEISNSTISSNSAQNGGGAVFATGGATVTISHSTVFVNTASSGAHSLVADNGATINLHSNIVANRVDGSDCETHSDPLQPGFVTATGTNLVGLPGSCDFGLADIIEGDPALASAFADNGGGLHTFLPLLESPVIDAGGPTSALATDQRGESRVKGGLVDLGAVEVTDQVLVVNSNLHVAADDDLCTLVEAFISAETNTASGGQPGECAAGSDDHDTLDLSQISGATITFTGGLPFPVVSESLRVNGSDVTVDGNSDGPLFKFQGSNFIIDSLSLVNATGESGPALHQTSGIGSIRNSTFTGNTASKWGGAVAAPNANLEIRNSVFTGNTSQYSGGAISFEFGQLRISDSTLTGNTATHGAGGAIRTKGISYIANTTISQNSAYYDGGGVRMLASASGEQRLTIESSTLQGNLARFPGGGVGFIGNNNGVLNIINSTISGNTAGIGTNHAGGGISVSNGTLNLVQSTVVDNSASYEGYGIQLTSNTTASLVNSIIANSSGGDDCFKAELATVNIVGINLIETPGSCYGDTVRVGGVIQADPMLGPLTNNGGSTETHAPLDASPVKDVAYETHIAAYGLISDQRGLPYVRIYKEGSEVAPRIDLGALEYQPQPNKMFSDGFESD